LVPVAVEAAAEQIHDPCVSLEGRCRQPLPLLGEELGQHRVDRRALPKGRFFVGLGDQAQRDDLGDIIRLVARVGRSSGFILTGSVAETHAELPSLERGHHPAERGPIERATVDHDRRFGNGPVTRPGDSPRHIEIGDVPSRRGLGRLEVHPTDLITDPGTKPREYHRRILVMLPQHLVPIPVTGLNAHLLGLGPQHTRRCPGQSVPEPDPASVARADLLRTRRIRQPRPSRLDADALVQTPVAQHLVSQPRTGIRSPAIDALWPTVVCRQPATSSRRRTRYAAADLTGSAPRVRCPMPPLGSIPDRDMPARGNGRSGSLFATT
jgi:hypothetical protein